MTPAQAARKRKAKPENQPGEHYTTDSYRLAIHRGCRVANSVLEKDHVEAGGDPAFAPQIEQWSPNRLRHSYATRMRAAVGAERTEVLMGHTTLSTTLVYAEADIEATKDIVEKLG